MDVLVSPAGLVAVMSCMALTGWALGRWQGGAPLLVAPAHAPQSAHRDPSVPPAPIGSALPHERMGRVDAADCGISLGELHDEVTAIRLRERVLATFAADALLLGRASVDERREGRRTSADRTSKCAASGTNDPVCTCGADCGESLRAAPAIHIRALSGHSGSR